MWLAGMELTEDLLVIIIKYSVLPVFNNLASVNENSFFAL